MSDYFTPQGLYTLQEYESGGNPVAKNPSSSASGLYGFLNGTWQEFAPQAGVDTSIYPTAASAPADVQTQVAAITPASNWLCPGCDAGITQAVSADPSLLTASPNSSDPLSDLSADAPNEANPLFVPGTDTPATDPVTGLPLGLGIPANTPETSSATTNSLGGGATDFWTQLLGDAENLASRAGLVLIGLILLAAAAFTLSRHG